MSSSNGHVKIVVAEVAVVETTDPVEPIPGELVAFRRVREAEALELRLKREKAIEKAGGPKASLW